MMQVISITPATVADRWHDFYPGRGWPADRALNDGRTPDEVEAKLRALPATATKEDINTVIGNHSWTGMNCTQCRADVSTVIHLEEPHEPHWMRWSSFHLCLTCAKRAVVMLDGGAV